MLRAQSKPSGLSAKSTTATVSCGGITGTAAEASQTGKSEEFSKKETKPTSAKDLREDLKAAKRSGSFGISRGTRIWLQRFAQGAQRIPFFRGEWQGCLLGFLAHSLFDFFRNRALQGARSIRQGLGILLAGLGIFLFDFDIDLLAMHADIAGGFDPQFDMAIAHIEHNHLDLVADHNNFVDFAAEYKHRNSDGLSFGGLSGKKRKAQRIVGSL